MKMRIDESGQDQVRSPVILDPLRPGKRLNLIVLPAGNDPPVSRQHRPVLAVTEGRIIRRAFRLAQEGERTAPDQALGHRWTPVASAPSNQPVMSLRSSAVMKVTLPGGMA